VGRADTGVDGAVVTPVVVTAPAKLTVRFGITGVRDDGYHLIDAEMVTLEWCDTLTIDATGKGLSADGRYAKGVPLNGANLVAKALDLVGRTAAVHIRKELPRGGGLGGGSADAAVAASASTRESAVFIASFSRNAITVDEIGPKI